MTAERGQGLGRDGQALIEGCVAIALLTVFFAVAVPGLVGRWNHFRCLHTLFERTHSVLVGHPIGPDALRLEVRERGDWVVGRAMCGVTPEEVRFRKL